MWKKKKNLLINLSNIDLNLRLKLKHVDAFVVLKIVLYLHKRRRNLKSPSDVAHVDFSLQR